MAHTHTLACCVRAATCIHPRQLRSICLPLRQFDLTAYGVFTPLGFNKLWAAVEKAHMCGPSESYKERYPQFGSLPWPAEPSSCASTIEERRSSCPLSLVIDALRTVLSLLHCRHVRSQDCHEEGLSGEPDCFGREGAGTSFCLGAHMPAASRRQLRLRIHLFKLEHLRECPPAAKFALLHLVISIFNCSHLKSSNPLWTKRPGSQGNSAPSPACDTDT